VTPLRSALCVPLLLGVGIGLTLIPAAAASLPVTSSDYTPYRSCVVTGNPSATSDVIDSYEKQGTPGTNQGAAATLIVQSGPGAPQVNDRVNVEFLLSTCVPVIPASATAITANLRLWASTLPAGACRTINVQKATATWTEVGINWTNQPAFSATVSTAFTIGPAGGGCTYQAAGYVDVTSATIDADVASWITAPANNFGWVLKDRAEGNAATVTTVFSAKNLGTLAQAPQLTVTYKAVP
jgi:hypothetical protein